jgi:flagellar protein FlaG
MDAGLTIRPTVNVAEAALVRPEPVPVRASVATTLAPSKSVTASADVARPQPHDPALASLQLQQQQQQLQQMQMRREVVIDAQTREVIFRVVDVRTGAVDHQVPDEALLRMRAYNRTLAQHGETPFDGDGNTDTEA